MQRLTERLARLSIPEPNTGCFLWIGPIHECQRGGYGVLAYPRSGRIWAHRAAYELAHGPIPAGLVVRHSCHQPACVNPAHLSVGTIRDNALDMQRAGRSARGERSARAKLTAAQVVEIRLRRAAGEAVASIARAFAVSKAAVTLIANRKRWQHLPEVQR